MHVVAFCQVCNWATAKYGVFRWWSDCRTRTASRCCRIALHTGLEYSNTGARLNIDHVTVTFSSPKREPKVSPLGACCFQPVLGSLAMLITNSGGCDLSCQPNRHVLYKDCINSNKQSGLNRTKTDIQHLATAAILDGGSACETKT